MTVAAQYWKRLTCERPRASRLPIKVHCVTVVKIVLGGSHHVDDEFLES